VFHHSSANGIFSPGSTCPVSGVVTSCSSVLDDQVHSALRAESITLFVTIGIELLAVIMAVVIMMDHKKRMGAYGYTKA
jgi:hypothetical protein